MEEKIKVLVVDDASFMIKAVSEFLESDPGIQVVGSAKNGLEGLSKIKELRPDVITLDIDLAAKTIERKPFGEIAPLTRALVHGKAA